MSETHTHGAHGFGDARRRGLIVFGVLAVLSLAEWWMSQVMSQPIYGLIPVALAKAWLILDSFMHVRQLRAGVAS